jgi:methylenetetrahydrofolate dehydrogenase (NADP+)/methenyltetrahydrofolate cyclohydrolase
VSLTPKILDGRIASAKVRDAIRTKVDRCVAQGKRAPGLAVVQVGQDAASSTYISQKQKAAEACGFLFRHQKLPRNSSFSAIAKILQEESKDSAIDGVVLQLPLDLEHPISESDLEALLKIIGPQKDADGLDPLNQGLLISGARAGIHGPVPATPLGVLQLLREYSIDVEGQHVVIVGRSRLVGTPLALLLLSHGATVTVCHKKTKSLRSHLQSADIVVAAAGVPNLIQPEDIRKGAVLVDVGIHRNSQGALCGDIDPQAQALSSAYSPVPGGVGPMTVAALMENVFELYQRNFSK